MSLPHSCILMHRPSSTPSRSSLGPITWSFLATCSCFYFPLSFEGFWLYFFPTAKTSRFFQLFKNSFPPFKDTYFKVLYQGEDSPFWAGPTGAYLFPLYCKSDHYLLNQQSFVTDKASLLDSDHTIEVQSRDPQSRD